MMNFKVIVQPVSEPISLTEAAMHLRLTPNDDSPPVYDEEANVRRMITAARQYCERDIMRALTPQVIEVALDSFPIATDVTIFSNQTTALWPADTHIELPYSPVTRIISIKYIDGDGFEQEMNSVDYFLSDYVEPNQVVLAFGASWPTTTQVFPNAVKIRYEAGYSTPYDSPNIKPIPESIKQAMLLLIGHYDVNRSAVEIGSAGVSTQVELAVAALLKPYQLRMSMA